MGAGPFNEKYLGTLSPPRNAPDPSGVQVVAVPASGPVNVAVVDNASFVEIVAKNAPVYVRFNPTAGTQGATGATPTGGVVGFHEYVNQETRMYQIPSGTNYISMIASGADATVIVIQKLN